MTKDRRSLLCQKGKHDAKSEVMKGRTITQSCAGYAFTQPCSCPCHIKKDGEK
jgi:hypothetical protein